MPKKFNFSDILLDIPQVVAESKVSITGGGQMLIPRDTWTKFGLEGLAVKVQWDPTKRALAFKRVFDTFESASWDKKSMRILTVNTATKHMRVPLGKLLRPIGLLGVSHKGLVLEKYHDITDDRDYYYVIIPKSNGKAISNTQGVEAKAVGQ